MRFIDARLPVRFGPEGSRNADEAVLTDTDAAVAAPMERFRGGSQGHALDCLCCIPRSEAAAALAALFRARAMSTGQPFRGVLAVVGTEGEAAVREALAQDPFAAGRFRLA